MSRVVISFDPHKQASNRAKHGLDFAALTPEWFEAATVYPAKDGRFAAIGELNGQVLTVIFALLGSEAVSVISMRPASRKERRGL